MRKNVLLGFLLVISFCEINAQINTPSGATKPFGSNLKYQYGIMPSNLQADDADLKTEYANWKTNYVENCGTDKARVKFDNTAQTVSEGIAYGMLLAAYAADKDLFDRLWAYYKNFRNSNGVMHWQINGCNSVNQQNGATDAELDAAMALIVANVQWPNSTSPHNYKTDGAALINAIKNHEVNSDGTFENGDAWKPACRNPSYQAPAYARAFKRFMSDNGTNQDAFWDNVATKTEALFAANAHSTSGLNTNWCTPAGPPNGSCSGSGTAPDKFGYDACRAPWRQAVDVLWYGPTTASTVQTVVNRAIDFWITKGAANVQGGNNMNHDGSGSGDKNCAFWGPVGAQTLATSTSTAHQTFCDQMYTQNKMNSGTSSYFTKILQMIGLFVQTGNFWNPYATTSSTTNQNPTVSLTASNSGASICAGTSLTLTATATDPDGTISKVEFYNGTTLLSSVTASPFTYNWTATTAGTVSITAKAYDNASTAGTATSTAVSVTVNSAPAAPQTTAVSYCRNVTATALTANGTSLKWYGTSATGGTSSTTAPTPSTTTAGYTTYYVTQTTNTCESARASLLVTVNSIPAAPQTTAVSYCRNVTATALTANGTSLKWYGTSATGGTSSTTAPTPSTTTAGNTTYYVTQTTNTCESARASLLVTVNSIPAAPQTTAVSYCRNVTATALTANGTSLKWYGTSATGGTSSITAPTPSTSNVGNTTYYVTQTTNTCESARASLLVTVNAIPSAPQTTTVSYCQNTTATALTANGTSLKWYGTSATGGTSSTTAPTPSTSAAGNTTYYVSQTTNTCESPRASLIVTVNALPSVPQTTAVTYCQNATATALTANGTSLKWYGTNASGGTSSTTAPTPSTSNVGNTTYYVTQTTNTCESPRASLIVTVNALPSAPQTTAVTYCQNATATALIANGTSLKWYGTSATGGTSSTTAPTPSTSNVGNTTYYVTQTTNTCESARASLLVTVSSIPSAPQTTAVSYCQNATATALTATGTSLKWYGTSATGGTSSTSAPTPSTSTVGNRTYYVTQTANTCESPRGSLVVTVNALLTPTVVISSDVSSSITAGTTVTLSSAITNGGTNPLYQWRNNGANINGATNSNYVTNNLVDGDVIDLVLTSNVACAKTQNSTSTGIKFSVITSIDDSSIEIIKIYPNPVRDFITVDGFNGMFKYQIVDNTGKLVLQGNEKNVINVSDLSSGVYVLLLQDLNKNKVLKFIVE